MTPVLVFLLRHPISASIVLPLLSLEVATPGTYINSSTLPSTRKPESSEEVISRMQPTLYATRPKPSWASRFGTSNICLVSQSPPCSAHELWGCEGLWRSDYGHALGTSTLLSSSTPPHPPSLIEAIIRMQVRLKSGS